MPMIADASGSPVGAMIVVSPVDSSVNGMLITCAIDAEDERDDDDDAERDQNRPRMRRPRARDRLPMVARSRMIAAGTRQQLRRQPQHQRDGGEHDQHREDDRRGRRGDGRRRRSPRATTATATSMASDERGTSSR